MVIIEHVEHAYLENVIPQLICSYVINIVQAKIVPGVHTQSCLAQITQSSSP